MSNPKRHHYLPEFYLDRFTDTDGFLWLFDRSQGKLRKEKPKNTAVIGHYYSLKDDSGARDPSVEEHLSLIEGLARPAFDSLESEGVTRRERYRISLFLGYLFCRVPAFARSLDEILTGLAEIILRKNLEDPEMANSFDIPPEELIGGLDSGEFRLKASDNMRIAQVIRQGEDFGKYFFCSSWLVAKAPARSSFLTCDNPFGLIFPPGMPKATSNWSRGSFSPEVARVFPISSRTCLLMHNMTGSSLDSIEINRDAVREINLALVSETETYAIARDENHLRSLARAGDLYSLKPSTKIVMKNHPDPAGDPMKSTLIVRRAKVK